MAILVAFAAGAPARAVDWGDSQWIGSTVDDRPEEWRGRDAVFNWPPADIHTWVPTEEELRRHRRQSFPSPLLRTEFRVDKPVRSAEVVVCGLGLYELHLNGAKVGDRVLDPAQTSYDRRAFYVRHDVTAAVRDGANAIGLMLGNGFYGQNMAFRPDLSYGTPRARLVLDIRYTDGSRDRVQTDDGWLTKIGPILFDNLYFGETYDARLADPDWCLPGSPGAGWRPAQVMSPPTIELIEQRLEPMRKVRAVEPASVREEEGGWIVDMGENMTGWLDIKVDQPAGTAITIRFAEHLMPGGQSIDTASTGIHATGGEQTDIYICRGGGEERWEPRFTYHGFRYAQIEGLRGPLRREDLTGWFVRTDMERTGRFECSDPLIQKFYDVSMRTIEGNVQGNLSDCPHRERCAWLGDIHAAAEAVSYNFDARELWRKTSRDIESTLGSMPSQRGEDLPRDARAPCNVAVGKRLIAQARPDWGAATVLVPWYSYLHYGDLELVRTAWPMMVGWMGFLEEHVAQDGVITHGYGDWCPPQGAGYAKTPVAITSTALYFKSLRVMAKMARALGKPDQAAPYEATAKRVQSAFHQRFFDPHTSGYGTQTANAVATDYGLVPESERQTIADRLAEQITLDCDGHYRTGIFGHRPLYTVLNDSGHSAVTARLWRNTTYPSLGFFTEQHQLTTWPEVPYPWDKAVRYQRRSFNHPMHSGFAAAFHESLGGIRPDWRAPGFKEFALRPCFLPGVDWVRVSLESPHGRIVSNWKRQGSKIMWSVTVPVNTSADVDLLPLPPESIRVDNAEASQSTFTLSAGSHLVTIAESKSTRSP